MLYITQKNVKTSTGKDVTVFVEKLDGEYVLITKNEYNGLQHALDIIHDRAKQEVKKSNADKHGYRITRGTKKKYGNQEFWYITKATPYSLKIDLEVAFVCIENDFKNYYNYDSSNNKLAPYGGPLQVIPTDYDLKTFDDVKYDENLPKISMWKQYGIDKGFLNKNGKLTFVFKIDKIFGANIGKGVYEVSYWATEPI